MAGSTSSRASGRSTGSARPRTPPTSSRGASGTGARGATPGTRSTRGTRWRWGSQSRTQAKNQKIRDLGYNLVEVYECELAKNKEFRGWAKTNDIEIVTPLNPRDAFFRGRTNVTKLKYEFKDGEKGRYVDFVSLYPTVQYFKTYPVGHPTKILSPEKYRDTWFGFVKCKVEPPKNLYHPVLPFRTTCGKSEKLLFPLCRTCAERQQQTRCEHTEEERALTGTWCTNELKMAVGQGYRILKIHEVWHFHRTTDTLFRD